MIETSAMKELIDCREAWHKWNNRRRIWNPVKHLLWTLDICCGHLLWTLDIFQSVINTDGYSDPYQTSMIDRFTKIANGWKLPTIFIKRSILDVKHGSKYTSDFKSWIQKPILSLYINSPFISIRYNCFYVAMRLALNRSTHFSPV